MKFPFQIHTKKKPNAIRDLRDYLKSLPPGGRIFYLCEGERVSPSYVNHPGDVVVENVRLWRPEGEAIPEPLEAIPGYQRPVNWRELQEAEDKMPERFEVGR